MYEIAIEDKRERPRSRHAAPKTRGFAVPLLGYITGNQLWDGGQSLTDRAYDHTDSVRPIMITLIGLATEIRPVVANLRMGSTAIARPLERGYRYDMKRVELLKSANYQWRTADLGDGTMVSTALLPDLTDLNVAMIDPDGVRFVSITPRWYAEEYPIPADTLAPAIAMVRRLLDIGMSDDDLATLAPVAWRLLAMLDRRSYRPMVNDLAFAYLLMLTGLRDGLFISEPGIDGIAVPRRHAYDGYTVADFGLDLLPTMFCNARQTAIDALVQREIQRSSGAPQSLRHAA